MKCLLPVVVFIVLCTTAAIPLSDQEEQQIRHKIAVFATNQEAPPLLQTVPVIQSPVPIAIPKSDPLDTITIKQIQEAGRIIDTIRGNAINDVPQSSSVVAIPTTVNIPADIREWILSLCGILITGAIGWSLTWMRAHFKFMQEVGANATITASATGFGALLEKELATQGKSLATVDVNNPTVAHFAQLLIDSYPEWGPIVGLTPEIAKRKVLNGGLVQSNIPIDVPPTIEIVNKIEPTLA